MMAFLDTKNGLIKQFYRYILVGSIAALIHLSLLWLCVEQLLVKPLYANIIAFFCAFSFSFFGQSRWTFSVRKKRSILASFFLLQFSVNFFLNQILFAVLLYLFPISYILASFFVLMLVSVMTFLISKFWIFK